MSDETAVAVEATEVTTTEETSSNAVTKDNQGGSRNRGKGKRGGSKRKGRKGRAESVVTDDPAQVIKARFAACGRCCYFLGSYTSAHGFGELETAVEAGLPEWLNLTWDHHSRMLVHKAFGVQLDVDYYMYEGCCVSCYRQFSLRTDEKEGTVFRVQL